MCAPRLVRFLVLAQTGRTMSSSVFVFVCVCVSECVCLYVRTDTQGSLCCAQEHRVLRHAELGNGEWKVQRCKSSAPLDSLER